MDKAKILIVDDSLVARMEISSVLKKMDYTIIQAVDGNDGLIKLEENPSVSLIIADHYMPNLSGIEMVKKIRESDQFRDIPIVMLTSESSEHMKEIGADNGILAWALKPCNKEVIAEVVQKILGANR
ncbi:MAG: response regulator [Oligoflexales bacterium]|nr:response regulator [Oligoflexales bacterium]